MMGDAFDSVLVPILWDLRDYLSDIVVIGGWVPELHRRFGDTGEWAVKPLRTTEVDILIGPAARSRDPASSMAEALAEAGFSPIGENDASAIWERDASAGERVEFFLDHAGPWRDLGTVQTFEPGSRLGGLLLSDLGVLRDHAETLPVPIGDADGGTTLAMVRVPELGAFLVHKGATFRRRSDPAKRAKDLHYIVDVMQSGEARIQAVERQIATYCAAGGPAGELARAARHQVKLVVNENATTALRRQLAQGLSVRHGITHEEGDARARGFLADFLGLIPEDCGGRST
jgi:nucleotidyltransferase-like protein